MHNAAPPTPTPLFGREGPLHACPYPSLAILWAPGNRLLQIIALQIIGWGRFGLVIRISQAGGPYYSMGDPVRPLQYRHRIHRSNSMGMHYPLQCAGLPDNSSGLSLHNIKQAGVCVIGVGWEGKNERSDIYIDK